MGTAVLSAISRARRARVLEPIARVGADPRQRRQPAAGVGSHLPSRLVSHVRQGARSPAQRRTAHAPLAGIRASTGDIVVTMDDDLQHPPEAILDLLQQLHESGDDVVYGTPCEPVHGQRRQFGGRGRGGSSHSSRACRRPGRERVQRIQGNAARGLRRAGGTSGVHRRRVVPRCRARSAPCRFITSRGVMVGPATGCAVDRGRRRHDRGVRHPAGTYLPAGGRRRSIGCCRRRAVAALTGPSIDCRRVVRHGDRSRMRAARRRDRLRAPC